jgi:hypothetical protein
VVATGNAGNTASASAGRVTTEAPSFRCGTLIAADRAEVSLEDLMVSNLLVTARGTSPTLKSIVSIGHRHIDLTHHSDPGPARPICIRAGAIAEGQPSRVAGVPRPRIGPRRKAGSGAAAG